MPQNTVIGTLFWQLRCPAEGAFTLGLSNAFASSKSAHLLDCDDKRVPKPTLVLNLSLDIRFVALDLRIILRNDPLLSPCPIWSADTAAPGVKAPDMQFPYNTVQRNAFFQKLTETMNASLGWTLLTQAASLEYSGECYMR